MDDRPVIFEEYPTDPLAVVYRRQGPRRAPLAELELPLDEVGEAYRAMDERRAIKTLLRP
jgi:hypothetical protein